MNISQLKSDSRLQIRQAGKKPYQLTLISIGIGVLASILVGVTGTLVAGYQGGEGLSGMGTASMLQAVEQLLNMVVQLLSPFWSVGLVAAMFAFANDEAASNSTLLEGFRRFLPFLRLYLLTAVYVCAFAIAMYLPAMLLYSFTPWAVDLQRMLDQNPDRITVSWDLVKTVAPLLVIYAVLLIVVLVPKLYRLRFATYFMVSGWKSALLALVTSNRLTKGKVKSLFMLDLSFWWYHLGKLLLQVVFFMDLILPALGYQLNMDPQAAYWLCHLTYSVGIVALETYAYPLVESAKILQFQRIAEDAQLPG